MHLSTYSVKLAVMNLNISGQGLGLLSLTMTLGASKDIYDSKTRELHHKKYLADQPNLQLPVNVLIEGESYKPFY